MNVYSSEIRNKLTPTTNVTEFTFRTQLENLLNEIAPENVKMISIQEPGRKEFGVPDFQFLQPGKIIGYIETKKLGLNINKLSKEDQKRFNKYKKNIENLILTNYGDFILYQNGKKEDEVSILNISSQIIEENIPKFKLLIEKFFSSFTQHHLLFFNISIFNV